MRVDFWAACRACGYGWPFGGVFRLRPPLAVVLAIEDADCRSAAGVALPFGYTALRRLCGKACSCWLLRVCIVGPCTRGLFVAQSPRHSKPCGDKEHTTMKIPSSKDVARGVAPMSDSDLAFAAELEPKLKFETATDSSFSPSAASSRATFVAQAGMIAATYAAATLAALFLLQGLAWGPVQFRVSEALCVLAALTPAAVPGLTAGCIIANLIALAVNGTGALGLLDVVFGGLATFLGAWWCWKMRGRTKLALLGPVLANALVVPAYLPLLLQGLGFYTIPFTSIALDGAYLPMYAFGVVSTGIGEALVMYVLGSPLLTTLERFKVVTSAKRVKPMK